MDTKEITERMVRELPVTDEGLSQAGLYGVLATGETFHMASAYDLYDLLDEVEPSPLRIVGLAVTTSGWAAPLNADGEVEGTPSSHPARRRVLLVALVTAEELISSMRFADDEQVVTDDGGEGALADALREALARATA